MMSDLTYTLYFPICCMSLMGFLSYVILWLFYVITEIYNDVEVTVGMAFKFLVGFIPLKVTNEKSGCAKTFYLIWYSCYCRINPIGYKNA